MSGLEESQTVKVPEAGKILGLGRAAAYNAVSRGDIPVIRIGRRILVSKAVLARMLQPESPGAVLST